MGFWFRPSILAHFSKRVKPFVQNFEDKASNRNNIALI